jgi:ABC-type Fe3+/spermidine/putrescine transport system ATPase subunit
MNVFENVAFGLRRKSVPKPRSSSGFVRSRADPLEEYGQRMIDQLSGGAEQRVAMARARSTIPPCFYWTNLCALDLQLRLQMQDELRRLQRFGQYIHLRHP